MLINADANYKWKKKCLLGTVKVLKISIHGDKEIK